MLVITLQREIGQSLDTVCGSCCDLLRMLWLYLVGYRNPEVGRFIILLESRCTYCVI